MDISKSCGNYREFAVLIMVFSVVKTLPHLGILMLCYLEAPTYHIQNTFKHRQAFSCEVVGPYSGHSGSGFNW